MSRDPIIRVCRATDINELANMDNKCYEYPYTLEDWQALAPAAGKKDHPRAVLIEAMRRNVGFMLWQYLSEETAQLIKLGILPSFRRNGLGQLLMESFVSTCIRENMKTATITVPEINCCPGEPDDCSVFLNKMGFTTTGVIVPNFAYMYGEQVEGFQFEMIL